MFALSVNVLGRKDEMVLKVLLQINSNLDEETKRLN